jgi:hypothetical protein
MGPRGIMEMGINTKVVNAFAKTWDVQNAIVIPY